MKANDGKMLLRIMQAIEWAKFYDNYNKKSRAVRIDTRVSKQMNWLTRHEFGRGLKKLQEIGALKIESFATAENENEQRHFQIKPLPKFKELFKKTPKFFDETGLQIPDKNLHCGNLNFNPSTGRSSYRKISKIFQIGTQPWSVLWCFMTHKNISVTRDELTGAIFQGWRMKAGKRQGKSESSINLERIIGRIRADLKMTQGGRNKNLIHGGGDNTTYKMTCS